MDYYNTLGVAKNATQDEIKKAYRRMAGIHHPDKGGDTAQFQKIQEAYETLSDPQKKQQYDNPNPFGHNGGHMGGFPGGFQFHMNGFNMGDIFGQMFGGPPGGGFRQQPSYRTTVWVTLEQVYSGGEQVLQFQSQNGFDTVKIQIPKGVDNGTTIRYDNVIKDGNLLVEFRVHPNRKYEREGPHLYSTHEISVFDLIVGSTFKFMTIGGKNLEVKVNPKTQPGSTMRLAGEGLPFNGGFGDQMILLKAIIPDRIDSRITDSILQSKQP